MGSTHTQRPCAHASSVVTPCSSAISPGADMESAINVHGLLKLQKSCLTCSISE